MSLKFFLKIYARLLAITAAVLVLCVLLFNGINSVRGQYWHEQAVEPLMRWLAAVPDPARQYHWMPSLFGRGAGGHRLPVLCACRRRQHSQPVA